MATHNHLGKIGEDAAVDYLLDNGYSILERNWRIGHRELDIVAREGNFLVIVEVKTRRNTLYAQPYESIDNRKIRNIMTATNAYVNCHNLDYPIRFDVITLIGEKPPFKIEHIKQAFYPPVEVYR